ncbi:MAG TPA: beta-propeller fold lactonase family protein [Solirubrobacteraceae bacterium]|jgi:6-phosphogluconolactonase (cycloisomerase 2 family)|nr:beta-propeller fold lactonase family protein [Solirubrobacteraceae bacterium]
MTAAAAATWLMAAAGSAAAQAPNRAHHDQGPGHAVFVQTDNLAGNAVAVYRRGHQGTLAPAGTYSTGGAGGVLAGSQVDHLASQNSLVYDAQAGELFAVNAGSDSVSVFDVHGDHLHLRQVTGSGGAFPVSIAAHGDLVYVLNALDGGTIQGYRLNDGFLSPIKDSSRSLGLDPNATPQFVTTPGDVAFSPGGHHLLVTTKANTNAIDVFAIGSHGRPASSPVVNSEPGAVPFALAFPGGHQVDVAEAGTNAVASFRLQPDGTLQPLASLGTGEAATCWLVADGPVLFAGNAGSGKESTMLDSASGALELTATTSTDPGTVDAATSPDGRYLYVQTGAQGIVDEFGVGAAGALSQLGSVTVPDAVGGEGIATS